MRDKTGKLEEANVTVEEWRAVIAESQRSILKRDGRISSSNPIWKSASLPFPIQRRQARRGDRARGPARVLIRTNGNTRVRPRGPPARIGRGPDNELVLDAKHISRHHADAAGRAGAHAIET